MRYLSPYRSSAHRVGARCDVVTGRALSPWYRPLDRLPPSLRGGAVRRVQEHAHGRLGAAGRLLQDARGKRRLPGAVEDDDALSRCAMAANHGRSREPSSMPSCRLRGCLPAALHPWHANTAALIAESGHPATAVDPGHLWLQCWHALTRHASRCWSRRRLGHVCRAARYLVPLLLHALTPTVAGIQRTASGP